MFAIKYVRIIVAKYKFTNTFHILISSLIWWCQTWRRVCHIHSRPTRWLKATQSNAIYWPSLHSHQTNAWHLHIQGCGRAHLWAIHPSAIGGGRSHYVSMICIPGATLPEWFVLRCQNMSASSPTTVLARRPKRDNLLTANHFKWCSQYYCHKTQNLNQIMPISTEECNCLSSALFQLLSELSSYIDTRF